MKHILKLLLAILLAFSACKTEHKNSLGDILKKEQIDIADLEIHINKSDYILSIVAAGKTLRQYPVVLGGNPIDDKRCEGDQCTPEGSFGIRDMYPHKKWSKFIWIDYPNEESWSKHKASKQAGEIKADATIGGEVGIHGVPANCDHYIDEKINWTLGCISLKNADINEFYPYITKKTRVFIRK